MDLSIILSHIRGIGKKQKLEAISDYIEESYNKHYEFERPEDILDTGIDFSKNDYENFMDLVTNNYSRYAPFYVYKMTLKENKKIKELQQLLEQISKNAINIDDKYEFSKIELKNDDMLELTIHYKKYRIFHNGKNYEREGIIKKGTITVIFNIKDSLLYINIGEDTLNNIVRKFLVDNLYTCISIKPLKITEPNIKYNGPIGVDKVTVFMLELLTRKIEEKNNFKINDYKKVGISNPKNDRIKSVMVRGNDLLSDRDVANKIENQFQLKTADFSLSWIQPNNSDAVKFDISISIQSTIKISIIESSNKDKNLDVIKELIDCVIDLLKTEIVLKNSIITHYFKNVKNRMDAQKKALNHKFMEMIMQDEELKRYAKKIEDIFNAV